VNILVNSRVQNTGCCYKLVCAFKMNKIRIRKELSVPLLFDNLLKSTPVYALWFYFEEIKLAQVSKEMKYSVWK